MQKLFSICFLILFFENLQSELKTSEVEFFESKIRPLLVEHCYKCHAVDSKKIKGGLLLDSAWGWQQGGDSGEVIVKGHPEKSLLIEMVNHDPAVEAMPPKYKLQTHEIEDLKTWIRLGAPDPRPKLVTQAHKSKYNVEERKRWWSLQPLKSTTPPQVKQAAWVNTNIDRFILKELENKNWQPAEAADRQTILRRLSYDLTGLPPTLKEQESFLSDTSPNAYEKIVNAYLHSPRFGEHWARKWMDLFRYCETKGFENDYTMPHVWKYRDYLIKVFNDDVPYNQFVRESFAGDLLNQPRLNEQGGNESIKGPGFFYLSPGHHGPPDLHGDEVRMFDNMIDVIGKTFLSTTISCARCHDHKFDAVSTKNFYSLYGMLSSSRLDYRNIKKVEELELQKLSELKNNIKTELYHNWRQDITQLFNNGSLASSNHLEKHKRPNAILYPLYVYFNEQQKFQKVWGEIGNKPESSNPSLGGLTRSSKGQWLISGQAFSASPRPSGEFILNTSSDNVISSLVGQSMAAGTLTSRMDGSLMSPTFVLDGEYISVKVKGRGAQLKLMIHHYELVGKGPTTKVLSKEINSDTWTWIKFPTHLWKGDKAYLEIQLNSKYNDHSRNGQHHYRHVDSNYVAVSEVLLANKMSSNNPWSELSHHKQLSDALNETLDLWYKNKSSLEHEEILSALLEVGVLNHSKKRSENLTQWMSAYKSIVKAIPSPDYVRTLADGHKEDVSVYIRGLHKKISQEPNPRHFIDGINANVLNVKGSGRLEWANQVVDPSNPLTPRVIVNRLWHHIYGRGIVASVDDFGKMGDQPSHPELLDHLAEKFMAQGWSIKTMLKEMVMSSTYRMSSRANDASSVEDPNNALLQHMPVRRISAESIRDTILFASSELRHQLYGSSVAVNLHDTSDSRSKPRQSGPLNGSGRRSIYLELRKNYLPHFLVSFDMPNSSSPFGRRSVTNVPAQSLTLLNDPFVHEQAEAWSKYLVTQSGTVEEKIDHIHRQLFARPSKPSELEWAKESLQKFGIETHEQSAWKELCHVMFNRKEMIYVF